MSSVPVITTTPLPPLTISGVLPPYLGTDPAKPGAMSPYKTTVLDVATRFCYSDQRRIIFNGLLNYRQRLHLLGLSDGFQWLCGSFMEDIETLEGRPPQDIDVITFYYQPAALRGDPAGWTALATGNSALFEPSATKTNFHCDAYFIDLEMPGTWIAEQTKYWFGLFSHRRGGLWKGLAQVPLAITSADALASTRIAGGTP